MIDLRAHNFILFTYVACTLVTVHTIQVTLMSPGQAKHVYVDMYALNYSSSTLENTDENKIFFVCSPKAFWLSSAPGVLSTLVTSVVLYSLTWATLMNPGQDETRVCGYVHFEFIHQALWRTLIRTKYFLFIHHKHFS